MALCHTSFPMARLMLWQTACLGSCVFLCLLWTHAALMKILLWTRLRCELEIRNFIFLQGRNKECPDKSLAYCKVLMFWFPSKIKQSASILPNFLLKESSHCSFPNTACVAILSCTCLTLPGTNPWLEQMRNSGSIVPLQSAVTFSGRQIWTSVRKEKVTC